MRLDQIVDSLHRRLIDVEEDLDCDVTGSLAQAIGDLRVDLARLTERVAEFIEVPR
jgi:hypothetical protein